MILDASTRKLVLTLHITASVGWLGAVMAFLALAVAGLASAGPDTVRGAYIAMSVLAWTSILPLCLASLVTGIIQSIGSTWGLFNHYWVVFKLVINVLSTVILVIHMAPIDFLAHAALEGAFASGESIPVRVQMIVASGLAVIALLVATVLSVYKPRGLTPYGRHKLDASRTN